MVMLSPADFEQFFKVARNEMLSMMGTVKRVQVEVGFGGLEGYLRFRRKKLMDKWCINFLAALLLLGGGQPPQVYG